MQAARKFESFCVEPGERWLFAGNLSGQIAVIDIDRFVVTREVQAHAGTIIAMAAHPTLGVFMCLGMDRTVTVWSYDERGAIAPLCAASIRGVRPDNDELDIGFVHSNAQTLGSHSTRPRMVTRSGNAGVLELEFDEDGLHVLRCTRLHGEWDVVTARYAVDSDLVLSGDGAGHLVLSDKGEQVRSWQVGNHSIHWIEHVAGDEYLIASDSRLLARVDISGRREPTIGPQFAADDFEQVTFNPVSGRAFASSFDRRVYELDPLTCVPSRVVFWAPFKCRWLRTLRRQPSVLVVQCRNGSMLKVDADTGDTLGAIKQTPEALWTAVVGPDRELIMAGEGDCLTTVRVVGEISMSLEPVLAVERRRVDLPAGTYTKRMDIQRDTGRLVLGRTDGTIALSDNGDSHVLADLGAAVRDLAVVQDRGEVLAACEDGCAYRLDLTSGERLASFRSVDGLPIWAVAYNPERDLVAFFERHGTVSVLAAEDFSPVATGFDAGRPKRAKWRDADHLVFSHGGELHQIDIRTGEQRELIGYVGNTIEDFIWDSGQNYIAMICYTWMLSLYDFQTYHKLAEVPDQIDYSKGLAWLPRRPGSSTYPLDFVTYGRSGVAHRFRVHNENLVGMGPVVAADPVRA